MTAPNPSPAAPNPAEFLQQLFQAALSGRKKEGGASGLGQAFNQMRDGLRREAAGAIAEFKTHQRKVRQSLPPLRVRVLPVDSLDWLADPAAQVRIDALVDAGFERVSAFRLDAIPNHTFAGFIHRQQGVQALVTRSGAETLLELGCDYADGRTVEAMDTAAKPGRPTPPWETRFSWSGMPPARLIESFLRERPTDGLLPVAPETLASRIEESFHRVQCWRTERGGFRREEIRAMRGLGEGSAADEQVETLRQDHAERWLCSWLTLQPRLEFKLTNVIDSLVIVHDEMTPDLVANAWWCGTGDLELRSTEFKGTEPLEVFRATNERRGRPLQLVRQKPAPFAADFYLPRPRETGSLGRSRLALALEAGLTKGDLRRALFDFREHPVRSGAEVAACCQVFDRLEAAKGEDMARQVQAVVRLFLQVPDGDSAAARRVIADGLPRLARWFDRLRSMDDPTAAMAAILILKVMARSGTRDGTDRVIEAIRQGWGHEHSGWVGVLGQYRETHPETPRLFAALAESLPDGSVAEALLVLANGLRRAGQSIVHPFDSPAGRKRLLARIRTGKGESVGPAVTATAAIPYLRREHRAGLIEAAAKHRDPAVRMEAAWASAALGEARGLRQLVASCRHWSSSTVAQQYLKELGRAKLIPAQVKEPTFVALTQMADWLAHPNELARMPDELEVVDHRRLRWPPKRSLRPFWVIRYRVKARPASGTKEAVESVTGVGLVGSITFCLFGQDLVEQPPEAVYAAHVVWEMQQQGLIQEEAPGVEESGLRTRLLKGWRGPSLASPVVLRIVRLAPSLKYPGKMVAVVRARQGRQAGFAIFDGERSAWHPTIGRMRPEEAESKSTQLLRSHIGRHLLGL